jgi:hypothetical protein
MPSDRTRNAVLDHGALRPAAKSEAKPRTKPPLKREETNARTAVGTMEQEGRASESGRRPELPALRVCVVTWLRD